MEYLKKTKILGAVGAILLIIGNFFPFMTIKFFGKHSVNFIEGDGNGVFTLILGIIALLLIFIDFIIAKIPEGKANFLYKLRSPKAVLVPAILSAIIIIVDSDDAFDLGSPGFGFWCLVIGVVALIAHAFIYKGDGDKE